MSNSYLSQFVSTREELRVEAVTIDAQKTTVTFEVQTSHLSPALKGWGGAVLGERLASPGYRLLGGGCRR